LHRLRLRDLSDLLRRLHLRVLSGLLRRLHLRVLGHQQLLVPATRVDRVTLELRWWVFP